MRVHSSLSRSLRSTQSISGAGCINKSLKYSGRRCKNSHACQVPAMHSEATGEAVIHSPCGWENISLEDGLRAASDIRSRSAINQRKQKDVNKMVKQGIQVTARSWTRCCSSLSICVTYKWCPVTGAWRAEAMILEHWFRVRLGRVSDVTLIFWTLFYGQ